MKKLLLAALLLIGCSTEKATSSNGEATLPDTTYIHLMEKLTNDTTAYIVEDGDKRSIVYEYVVDTSMVNFIQLGDTIRMFHHNPIGDTNIYIPHKYLWVADSVDTSRSEREFSCKMEHFFSDSVWSLIIDSRETAFNTSWRRYNRGEWVW
ncbi:MAG: hypothetical protein GY799_12295 [Desulfobulbaceae bacterium]|nr:hypothetical protein [Desulfobulbaceae bacterium]